MANEQVRVATDEAVVHATTDAELVELRAVLLEPLIGTEAQRQFDWAIGCLIARIDADAKRIAELEHEVSVYLKRIDEAQARMSNLESDKTELEQRVAELSERVDDSGWSTNIRACKYCREGFLPKFKKQAACGPCLSEEVPQ